VAAWPREQLHAGHAPKTATTKRGWLLGLVSSYTLGGFIHILLVIAVIMILINLISSRKRE
jgi:hypothetical protein